MGARQGTNSSDPAFYMSTMGPLVGSETAHGYDALGGNDTVYGSVYIDFIDGGSGNDTLYGFDGDDALLGRQGSDKLYGGNGDDFLHGGSGYAERDIMNGGAGDDTMSGAGGDDVYIHDLNGGVDTINDGASETWQSGFGGGNDYIQLTGISAAQFLAYHPEGSNDLWLSSVADFSDGYFDDGIIIEDFYTADASAFIEWAYTSDLQWINLTQFLTL